MRLIFNPKNITYVLITILTFSLNLLIIFPVQAQHQGLKFKHLSIEHGLSQNSVNCILQDKKGFLWFGTQDGLNRYDGYNFKIYRHDPANQKSISNNFIYALYEDRNGNLWIGTSGGGLNKFDCEKEEFICYKNNPDDPKSLSSNVIFSILEDNTGALWVGSRDGVLNLMDHITGTFTRFPINPKGPKRLGSDAVCTIYEDSQNTLWIGSYNNGLNKFDRKTGVFTHIKINQNNTGSEINRIWKIYEDEDNILWIGTLDAGLIRFDQQTGKFTSYQHDPQNTNSIHSNTINSILEDRDGMFWIGTGKGGLHLFDKNKGVFKSYGNRVNDNKSISGDKIMSLFEDQSGVLWIGTLGCGLSILKPGFKGNRNFKHYQKIPDDPNSLGNNFVCSFCEDHKKQLWIGTVNGVYIKDPSINHFVHLKERLDTKQNILNKCLVWSIIESSDRAIWICSFSNGLYRLKLSSNNKYKVSHYKHNPDNPNSISSNNLLWIYEDKEGTLWICTFDNGLDRYIPKENKFVHYQYDAENSNSISSNSLMTIFEDTAGNLWIGALSGGLCKLEKKYRSAGKFINYKQDINNPSSLSGNIVPVIYEDRSGALWVGTDGGLNKFDPESETFTHYTTKDGLPNNFIYGILEDDEGNLWLSTNNGISKFNVKKNEFKNYGIEHGLQGFEFNQAAYLKNNGGEMFFGGMNGFNAFSPDSIKCNPYIPPVVITDFKIFNKSVSIASDKNAATPLKKSIIETDEITLSYKNSVFSFEFSALDFISPKKNKYAYMLEGFDNDWVYSGNRRFVTYTNIDAGKYVFRVKGSNNDGVWNERGVSIKIVITPPWWQTRWAYIFYLIIIAGAVLEIRRRAVNKQKRKGEAKLQKEKEQAKLREATLRAETAEAEALALEAQQQVEKEQMRSRIASDLHDEIGGNLSSIALTSQMLEGQKSLDNKTKKYLHSVRELAQSSADAIRDIVWFINPENEGFHKLIEKMHYTAKIMLEPFQLNIEDNIAIDLFGTDVKVRRNFYLIYKEVLQNVLKHSKAKKVNISWQKKDNRLFLMVEDDGIGFNFSDYSDYNDGNGLKNIQRRAHNIDALVQYNTEPGCGAKVTISLKIP